ncbi:discoidin domain-containing protein [Sanguibacter antarcticus]|uniref:galactose-binding domain-containing protein n=1 Tax=Sanguibacter antarcticus TaxID=372484 RepID=UPI00117A9D06|nr:discoidin domain-containing protein [Sanguibacter antarcticus]
MTLPASSDASGPGEATPSPVRRRAVALVSVGVLLAGAGTFAALRTSWPAAPQAPAAAGATAAVAATGSAPVCGLPDVAQVTDDGAPPVEPDVLVADVTTVPGGRVLDVEVSGDVAAVLEWDAKSTYTVTRYDLAGGQPLGGFDIDLAADEGTELFSTEQMVLGSDGAVYLLDTLDGRRDLLRYSVQGSLEWRRTIAPGPATDGSVLSLFGLALFPAGTHVESETVGVHEGPGMHLLTADGEDAGTIDGFPGTVVGQAEDGSVITLGAQDSAEADGADTDAPAASSFLTVVDPAGTQVARLGSRWDPDAPDAVLTTYRLGRVTGADTGPDGTGTVVAENGRGLEWFGPDGVREGYWPDRSTSEEHTYELAEGTPLLLRAGSYVFLVRGESTPDGEAVTLATLGADEMLQALTSPVKYNDGSAPHLAVIGAGAGLVTDTVYGYFRDGDDPAVTLRLDETWADAPTRYTLRYQVRGDPRVPDPVASAWVDADLPTGGGDLPLTLPPARAGVYEVDARLVDTTTGTEVVGTCLRYAIGAPGLHADLAALPDGADWGGAGPLRGVALAGDFRLGSHRYQVDFGALVPDPSAVPGPDGLDWDALPLDDLAAAAELAARTDVHLVVQVGQGGDAERAAVEEGTWEGWVREIVAGLGESAPGIVYYSPWNEPNNTGLDDGAAYVRDVGDPFATGARAADPGVVILGGNTLGVPVNWWRDAVDAGACASLDVVAVHPYTGLNRSWEEDGWGADGNPLDRLAEVLDACGDVPVWDTESGWWSDGVVNTWAQGSDVARKLLWYSEAGVEEWTYFFSEGGFGETGNSWSLVQLGQHVKPGLLSYAATQSALGGRGAGERVDLAVPGTFALRWADGTGSAAEMLAAWTDDRAAQVVLTATGTTSVSVADVYGAVRTIDLSSGPAQVELTGAPQIFTAPVSVGLTLAPVEEYGPDLLEGADVTASSTAEGTSTATVTDGSLDDPEPWRSGPLPAAGGQESVADRAPWVEVELDGPAVVDRVIVATAGIRCCTAGLRDYTVSVLTGGTWVEVASVTDQLHERAVEVAFDAVEVSAVRIDVPTTTERGVPVASANYSGVVAGMHPSFMDLTAIDQGIAVSAIEAFGPG